jgi:hypothetical protein
VKVVKNIEKMDRDEACRDVGAYVEEGACIEGMWDSRIELGRASPEEQAEGRKKTEKAHTEREETRMTGKNKRVEQPKEGGRGPRRDAQPRERKADGVL